MLTLSGLALVSGCVVRASSPPVAVGGTVYVDPGPPAPPPPVVVEQAPMPPPPQESADYATVYPTVPAPEPIPEYRPAPPGYGYAWVDGYWDWAGYDWSWNSGYWVPERVGFAYMGPRYVFVDGRPVYYRGYWQGSNGYREYGYGGGRGAPPSAWRAQPQTAPSAWRAQPAHNNWHGGAAPGWRGAPAAQGPAAGGWRGNAAAPAPAPVVAGAETPPRPRQPLRRAAGGTPVRHRAPPPLRGRLAAGTPARRQRPPPPRLLRGRLAAGTQV